ncbi:hypothetical protein R1sor_016538 [Riccia sorocarpa]|uniref:Uncharacterized protein n=1 Tax=Riccia sorocarpa TaxID=122646 RepID=A0ABD3HLI6_9MARC
MLKLYNFSSPKHKAESEAEISGGERANETSTREREEEAKQQEKHKSSPAKKVGKNIYGSKTISIAGSDVDGEVFDKLTTYMDQQTSMGIMALERGDAHLLLHMILYSCKCIKEIVGTGQYMLAIRWLAMGTISLFHTEKLWQFCVTPEGVTIAKIDHVFFGQPSSEHYMTCSHWTEVMIKKEMPEKTKEDHLWKPNKIHQAPGSKSNGGIPGCTAARQAAKEKHPEIVEMEEMFAAGADPNNTKATSLPPARRE